MSEPRYGIWIPVYGNCGAMNHPNEPRDASYARAKSLIQLAEASGFTTTLIAEHLINPRNPELDQLETWTAAAALAEATKSIEIIAAVKPLLFHPVVLAKMALGIDAISNGRFAINLVSAWFKPEIEKSGIPFLPQLRYELHIVAILLLTSRLTQINDPGSASFAAERILPDEFVHRQAVVQWWQRKYDQASPAERSEWSAQMPLN